MGMGLPNKLGAAITLGAASIMASGSNALAVNGCSTATQYGGGTCAASTGSAPCDKYVATSTMVPGNPQPHIQYYRVFYHDANGYYEWVYVGNVQFPSY